MPKTKTVYVCSACGEESITWQGKCPVCAAWNTFKEFSINPTRSNRGNGASITSPGAELVSLATLEADTPRLSTGFSEFDRVLGGGLVRGSVILLGGEPGIGKSTLLLQVANALSQQLPVMIVSGEESAYQVANRAKRLGLTPHFLFANETRLPAIRTSIEQEQPECVIVDSIQTLYDDAFPSTPGSLVQVRECALQLQEIAKAKGICIILIGHITKEGTVAGPKTLEHMVDVVLYLEGDQRTQMRILRSMKNRFGATHEVGLFELQEAGMINVTDPSGLFTEEHTKPVAGTALTIVMEGARPMLVEVQALVVPTVFGYPKRTSLGIDLQRLHILLAILQSRVGVSTASADVFVNVVGGYKIEERGADLALAMAILSAASHNPLPSKQVFFGEIGLTGEIRTVTASDRRLKEIERMGYSAPPRERTIREIAKTLNILPQRRERSED